MACTRTSSGPNTLPSPGYSSSAALPGPWPPATRDSLPLMPQAPTTRKAVPLAPWCAPAPLTADPLADVPLAFVRDSLLHLAPRLLAGGDSITPILPSPPSPSPTCSSPSFETLPPVLDCVFEPPPSLPEGYALPPTHLLAVTCPSTSSAHSHDHAARGPPQRVLVPIHALPWSLVSPLLAARLAACAGPVQADAAPPAGPPTPPSSPPSPSSSLSASPPTARLAPPPTAHLALPVVPLVLHSLAGLAALHAFVYTRTLGSPWPQHSLFNEDALEGVVACAEALGVEGEAGRELGEVVARAWAESGWEEDGEGSVEGWSGQREEDDGEQGMASD